MKQFIITVIVLIVTVSIIRSILNRYYNAETIRNGIKTRQREVFILND